MHLTCYPVHATRDITCYSIAYTEPTLLSILGFALQEPVDAISLYGGSFPKRGRVLVKWYLKEYEGTSAFLYMSTELNVKA